jgi:hypothetical protein
MRRASSPPTLVTQVELALLAGRSLEQIEAEILDRCDVDEESQAAAWLYAWSREDQVRDGQLPLAPGENCGWTRLAQHLRS